MLTNIAFNEDGSLTITKDDGSTVVYTTGAVAPVVTPEDVEVDLVLSDGSTKKFVPAA